MLIRLFKKTASRNRPRRNRSILRLEQLEDRVTPTVTIDSLSMPYSAYEGQSVSFSAGATESNQQSITYAWDFGDGTSTSGTGLTDVSHTYAANVAGGAIPTRDADRVERRRLRFADRRHHRLRSAA